MATESVVPEIRLNDGNEIPQLGFGVFRVDPAEAERIVGEALAVGYRHIDTAAIYGNEIGVGKAIAASGIPRDELFITTKLFNSDQGTQSAFDAIDLSLEKLGLDHVDLYLIHWPVPGADKYVESWQALEKMKADGRARSIGVSNFQVAHLDRVIAESDTIPAINQIELHPLFAQRELRAYGAEHGIAIEAWFPLGGGAADIMGLPAITEIAAELGVSAAQVILRWHLQSGLIIFPKTNSLERMRENLDLFGFDLSADQMAAIDALDAGARLGGDPDKV
jgi:2,5-diketo-D-gluconate reductase A